MTSSRLLLFAALFATAACSVPSLKDVGDKKCDLDAGHECVEGYVCVAGTCRVPSGGTCTEGSSRPCGSDIGECTRGTQQCVGGAWGTCEGAVGPVTETCDGRDNDCNDAVDDGLLAGPECELTQGVCAGTRRACVDGGFEAACPAARYGTDYEITESRCDDRDNDCDGMTDEGVTGGACPATGVCAGNVRACTMGSPGVCQAPGFEAVETSCDTLDNDCDGLADEDLVDTTTTCAKQAGVCAGKRPACVGGAYEPSCTQASYGVDFETAETLCDGKDNDCNGTTDRLADGGLITQGMCELSAGVCAGSRRACVGGNGEAPCTQTSYGPLYEAVEGTCDGLDNDCDGRPDVSKEAALVLTANAPTTHLGLAPSTNGGSAAVYVDERRGSSRVFFRRYDAQLRALGNEIELSDPLTTNAVRPAITRVGADFAVVWLETLGGSVSLKLARLSDSGTVAWSKTVVPAASVFNDPRVASASPSNSPILVAWVEAPGLVLKGATYDGAGNALAVGVTLSPAPDAGGDFTFDVDAVRRSATGDFLVGWLGNNGLAVRFRAFTNTLVPVGTTREVTVPGETARNIRVAIFPPSGEAMGAWLGTIGITQTTLHWMPNALSSPQPQIANVFAGQSSDLALGSVAGGTAAFWAQGLPQPHLVGLTLGADAGVVTDFTPGGVTGLFAPGVAPLPTGVLQVGYEANRGAGMDLYGQVVCRP